MHAFLVTELFSTSEIQHVKRLYDSSFSTLIMSPPLCFLFGPTGASGDIITVLCPAKHQKSENSPAELQPADLRQTGAIHG